MKRVVVAMSGGVDSSVAAALLVERGYDVTGVMLKLWRGEAENNASGCCNLGAADDARRVADTLGIPFYVLNFADRFEDSVVRNFKDDYAAGRTPNPCVRCNQWIKFDALLEKADALGADALATGHYARVDEANGRFRLRRGVDPNKDQSYVLWMLSQSQLARCLFPVGDMEKSETRRIAAELGLRTAAKPDSQEICFVRDGDVGAYIRDHVPAASIEGPIFDGSGDQIGRHRGIGNYTIGQRRGLGISLGTPVFVNQIDPEKRSIVVGARSELEIAGFRSEETSWTGAVPPGGTAILVQHRAHGETTPGSITEVGSDACRVVFHDPVEAVAPGQSAAFYSAEDPDELIGGGIISETERAGAIV
jgi:tRNA-specific 2-thiouridylase